VASAFLGNEGELNSIIIVFSSCVSVRSDGPSSTSSRCENSRSHKSDGERLLLRDFCGRTKEPPCSSRYHRTNTEANDRMWVFHSRICTAQLWRYVAGLLEHNGSVTKGLPERVIVHPFADVDGQIAAFCTTFAELRKDFDSGISVTTALVLSRTVSSVDMIGECVYTLAISYCLIFPCST
jgi:hypothetical protein